MNFDIESISPDRNDKYSENLYKWLKKNPHYRTIAHLPERPCAAGWPYIGGVDTDGRYIGIPLNFVLRHGAKQQVFYFGGYDFVPVPDFWEKYLKIGRCVLDPNHTQSFVGDKERFHTEGDRRRCEWCGAFQTRRHWEEVVQRSAWEMEEV